MKRHAGAFGAGTLVGALIALIAEYALLIREIKRRW